MTHVRVWRFVPATGREAEFARAYSKEGRWAELFGQAKGYRGTSLLAPSEPGGCWLTLDRWDSAADFESFSRNFAAAYRALDAELEGVAGQEDFVGSFEERG